MLIVEKNAGGIDSYKLDEGQLGSNFEIENGVLYFQNEHIEITVSQNEKGQNLIIKETANGDQIVDESTEK